MKLSSVESVYSLAAKIYSEHEGCRLPWVLQPNRDQPSESGGHDIVIEPRGCDGCDVSRAASDVGVASAARSDGMEGPSCLVGSPMEPANSVCHGCGDRPSDSAHVADYAKEFHCEAFRTRRE
jgi:hypothetical protein